MNEQPDEDLTRIKELLNRTREFIAYFELAEMKLMGWRQEIDEQNARILKHSLAFQKDLSLFQNLISQAGTGEFKQAAEQALAQGEDNLKKLEYSCTQFTQNFERQQDVLNRLQHTLIEKMEQHTIQAREQIAAHLAKYDVQHFHRIASESCDNVARVSNEALDKTTKLFGSFQVRLGFFTVLTAILTSFVISLYLNDEFPWELHHQALNERQAGKVLLKAWPNLSQNEKTKILNGTVAQNG